ncbi:AmmeMemoRadiSam system protein A [Thermodesulfobacteriota bacterium]
MTQRQDDPGSTPGLTEEEKRELRIIARSTVERTARGEAIPGVQSSSEHLKRKQGVFVTLYKSHLLRGCKGSTEGSGSLIQTVQEIARGVSLGDTRFRPIADEELAYVDLEISVLGPLTEIRDPSDIMVGRHGLMIQKKSLSGIFLPQVAAQRNWDSLTFLSETCKKAGLSGESWKDEETRLYVFSAEVF